MGDNEIIKALKYCANHKDCDDGCPCVISESPCVVNNPGTLLNLINRQKAEIERLNKQLVFEAESAYDRGTKAAAREFAKKLKEHCNEIINQEWNKKTSPVSWADAYEDFIDDIDNLVKEMTEENKNNA